MPDVNSVQSIPCRFVVPPEDVERAIELLKIKMAKKMAKKGNLSYASKHEAYGLIAEEFNLEALEALHKNKTADFEDELLDVAVGCIYEVASCFTRERNNDRK